LRRYLVAIIAAVAVVGILLVMRALSPHDEAGAVQSLQYSLARAHYGDLKVTVTGSGSIQAGTLLDVAAQQSGTVVRVPVATGSRVQAGEVLAEVSDGGQLQGALLAAQAQLASDQASLDQVLHPTAPSATDIQAAEQRIQTDEANIADYPKGVALQQQKIAADQGRVAADEQDLTALTVTSPVSGVLSTVGLSVGQSVAQGQEAFEVVQPDNVEVDTSVPQIDLSNVYVGQGVQVWTENQGTLDGAVSDIGLTANGTNRQGATFPVTVTLENPPSGFRAGMAATVNFTQFYLSEPGTVEFANPEAVMAQVSGTVQTVALQAGDPVQAGQTVVTLANPGLQTQLTADETQLSSDQAQLESDQAQISSYRAQLSTDEASLQSLEHPTPPGPGEVASLRARIASDANAVSRARTAAAQLDIVSPIAGVVTAVNVQQGSEVAPGLAAATPFQVEDPNSLEVVVPISEISIAQVAVGQEAAVTADALPGETFRGSVAEIAPAGTTSQGVATFNVTIDVPHPGALRTGMSADVSIRIASRSHVLLVPNEAVSGYGDQASVQVMVKGVPKLRHVVMGLSNEVDTEIVSGLAPGTQVVTAKASTGTVPLGQSSTGGK